MSSIWRSIIRPKWSYRDPITKYRVPAMGYICWMLCYKWWQPWNGMSLLNARLRVVNNCSIGKVKFLHVRGKMVRWCQEESPATIGPLLLISPRIIAAVLYGSSIVSTGHNMEYIPATACVVFFIIVVGSLYLWHFSPVHDILKVGCNQEHM